MTPTTTPSMTVEQSKEYNESVLSSFLEALKLNDDSQKMVSLAKFHLETDFEKSFLYEKGVVQHVTSEIELCVNEKKTTYLSKYLDFIADLCKAEALRKPLGETNLINILKDCLEMNDLSVQCATLRSIANMSAETQENKEKFVSLGVLNKILTFIKNPQPTLIKFYVGALVNLSQDSESIQKTAIDFGTMQDLITCLNDEDPEILKTISFAILNLIDTDEGLELFTELKGINEIIKLYQRQNETIQTMSIEAIRLLSEDDRVQRLLYESNCVPLLLNAVSSDMKVETRRMAAKAVAGLLTNDDNMVSLFQEGKLEGFKEWLQDPDDEVRAYAALCIGNLARKDEYCIKMVQNGLTENLVKLLKNGNSKEQQGAMSALRNLSLAPVNKTSVGNSGLIEELDNILNGDNLHTKFSAVTILKILVTGNLENSLKCMSLTTYPKVIKLIEISVQEAIKCESARVYVQASRTRDPTLLDHLSSTDVSQVLDVLLNSKHDILKEEGVELASNLLVSNDSRKLIMSAFENTLLIQFLSEGSPSMQSKTLGFLNKLIEGGNNRDLYLTEEIKSCVEKLKSSDNEEIKTISSKICL